MWWEILPSAAIIGGIFWALPTASELLCKGIYNTGKMRDHTNPVGWNYFQRDRDNSYSTWFTRFTGQKVSEGCPYQSYGLEKIPDNYERKRASQ